MKWHRKEHQSLKALEEEEVSKDREGTEWTGINTGRRDRKEECKGILCAAVGWKCRLRHICWIQPGFLMTFLGCRNFSQDLAVEATQLRTEWELRRADRGKA